MTSMLIPRQVQTEPDRRPVVAARGGTRSIPAELGDLQCADHPARVGEMRRRCEGRRRRREARGQRLQSLRFELGLEPSADSRIVG